MTAIREWAGDVAALARRNLVHVRREPAQLSDATIQPVLFTLLFVELFGAAMVIPGGGTYKAFAIGGLLTMNLTTASVGTAVGMSGDLSTGVMDRFRTLPMTRSAILAGRTVSDILAALLCGVIVLATGLAIGWRPEHGPLSVVAALGVVLLFGYALSWAMACMGLRAGDPESAQATAFVTVFPLSFVSSAMVPTNDLPTVLRVIAEWNPVSAVAASARELLGNPNPTGLSDAFPSQHPLFMALVWSAGIIAVCAPLATRMLGQRMAD
jgi:ABC transporter DrrB family efflux protein